MRSGGLLRRALAERPGEPLLRTVQLVRPEQDQPSPPLGQRASPGQPDPVGDERAHNVPTGSEQPHDQEVQVTRPPKRRRGEGADGIKGAVRHVDDPHDAEDEAEAGSDEEKNRGVEQ